MTGMPLGLSQTRERKSRFNRYGANIRVQLAGEVIRRFEVRTWIAGSGHALADRAPGS